MIDCPPPPGRPPRRLPPSGADRMEAHGVGDDPTIIDMELPWSAACVESLGRIVTNPDADPSIRVAAAIALLDRGWGRPPLRAGATPVVVAGPAIDEVMAAPARILGEC